MNQIPRSCVSSRRRLRHRRAEILLSRCCFPATECLSLRKRLSSAPRFWGNLLHSHINQDNFFNRKHNYFKLKAANNSLGILLQLQLLATHLTTDWDHHTFSLYSSLFHTIPFLPFSFLFCFFLLFLPSLLLVTTK